MAKSSTSSSADFDRCCLIFAVTCIAMTVMLAIGLFIVGCELRFAVTTKVPEMTAFLTSVKLVAAATNGSSVAALLSAAMVVVYLQCVLTARTQTLLCLVLVATIAPNVALAAFTAYLTTKYSDHVRSALETFEAGDSGRMEGFHCCGSGVCQENAVDACVARVVNVLRGKMHIVFYLDLLYSVAATIAMCTVIFHLCRLCVQKYRAIRTTADNDTPKSIPETSPAVNETTKSIP